MMRERVASVTRRCLGEAVGTFFLVLVGCGSVALNVSSGGSLGDAGIAFAFGAVVTVMIYLFGRTSGAHINPAVTVGFWSTGHFPRSEVVPYVFAQCAGATLGALLLVAAFGPVVVAAATVPSVPLSEAFVVEWVISFVLMFVITSIAVLTDARYWGALVVGLTVGFNAYLGGSLTGASMNPARSLGPAIASGVWEAHWLYWVAPITGMIAASKAVQFFQRLGGDEGGTTTEDPITLRREAGHFLTPYYGTGFNMTHE